WTNTLAITSIKIITFKPPVLTAAAIIIVFSHKSLYGISAALIYGVLKTYVKHSFSCLALRS
ncbi:MAG: hypothetical protein M3227_03245, partial [Thermoproteota archaeon]|nr:hypothetical protein [Thermoproteota archaeon]